MFGFPDLATYLLGICIPNTFNSLLYQTDMCNCLWTEMLSGFSFSSEKKVQKKMDQIVSKSGIFYFIYSL